MARILPITAQEAGPFATSLTEEGYLRLLPDSYQADKDSQSDAGEDGHSANGNDGFFIARLQRI